MLTTAELVRTTQAGEQQAFAELVRRYERSAIVTAFAVLNDFHAAQDAAQDGFVAAYQSIRNLRDAESFGPWLLQIVRRRALELHRKAPTPLAMHQADTAAACDPNPWIIQFQEVVQAVARLPEQERSVVMLRYLDGHPVADIAQLTGRPVGTVTKQISRAIERLRNWLIEVSP